MLRRKCLIFAVLALALMLTACDIGKQAQQGSDTEVVLSDENKKDPGAEEDDDDDDDDTLEKPAEELRIDVKAAVVGDCTGIGFAPIMGWGEKDKNHEKYSLSVAQTADEAAQMLKDGSADIAILPLSTAVDVYNTDRNIAVLATNTFNNMYFATLDDTITEKVNLSGMNVSYSDDQSLTSAAAKKLITASGATPVPVESNEAIQAGLIDGSIQLAVVPEPYITLAKMSNDDVEMGPDVTEIWADISDSDIISSVLVAKRSFADENAASMGYIIDDFRQSVNTVIHGVPKTLEWSSEFNIVPDKSLAVSTMKNCNYNFTSGSEMRAAIKKFLKANADAVPEDMTDDGFYFVSTTE